MTGPAAPIDQMITEQRVQRSARPTRNRADTTLTTLRLDGGEHGDQQLLPQEVMAHSMRTRIHASLPRATTASPAVMIGSSPRLPLAARDRRVTIRSCPASSSPTSLAGASASARAFGVVLKIDVQGYELRVLRGGGNAGSGWCTSLAYDI